MLSSSMLSLQLVNMGGGNLNGSMSSSVGGTKN